jgi:hypothetical protein
MRERGCFPTTPPAQLRRPCRPRHPYAVPRTYLQCVCTRHRNCIGQLSPFLEYAPRTANFPARNCATPPSQALTPYFSGSLWCRGISHDTDRSPLPERRGTHAQQPTNDREQAELSPCAVSVLGQLFVEGPTSEDNITNKAGRCDLVSAALAFHEAGLSSLTPDGARLTREWDLCSLFAVSHSKSGTAVR